MTRSGDNLNKSAKTHTVPKTTQKAVAAARKITAANAGNIFPKNKQDNTTSMAHDDTLVMQPLGMPGASRSHKSDRTHKKAKTSPSFLQKAKTFFHSLALTKDDETAYFEPKTWFFWRGMIMYFFIFSVVGHWMEIPYCLSMDALFGIVADDYALWEDALYVPYWVYGAGAAAITMLLLPMKINIVGRRKTMWGAALEFLVIAIVLCAALECIMGWICNQPDEFGEYPYWDNSVLPLNIFGQAWLVNDFFLGLVSLAYVWFIFPFCQKFCKLIGNKASNYLFVGVLVVFAIICILSYAV